MSDYTFLRHPVFLNTQGAVVGLLVGLSFIFWIGIGAIIYPPYVDTPPLSVEGCGINATTTMTMVTEILQPTTTP